LQKIEKSIYWGKLVEPPRLEIENEKDGKLICDLYDIFI